MRWAWVACALVGCGRYAFQTRADAAGSGASDGPQGPSDGPRDAPPDGPPGIDAFEQTAACTGFAVCDSFETSTVQAPWTVGTGVAVDTTHAHRGMQSIHMQVPALTAGQDWYSQIGETATLSALVPPVTFYVRGWFYLDGLPVSTNRMELISIESMASSIGDYTFLHSDDTVLYTQADAKIQMSGVTAPLNTWFCIAMKITRNTTTGQLAFTSDVIPPLTLTNVITDSNSTPVKLISLGIGFAGTNVFVAQPAFDLWIDDVIVDPNPVTCAD